MFGIRLPADGPAAEESPEPTEAAAEPEEQSPPFIVHPAPAPAPVPAQASGDDYSCEDADPDSIAAYMQRLLARNRKQSDHYADEKPIARPRVETKPAPQNKPADVEETSGLDTARWFAKRNEAASEETPQPVPEADQATRINPLPAEYTARTADATETPDDPAVESPAEIMRPRYQRDQLRAGLDSMREVANLSARAAIAKCNWKRMRMQVAFTSGITACSLATTVALLSSPLWASVSYLKYGLISAGLTALAGAELFRNVWKIYGPQMSHRKSRKDEDAEIRDAGDEESSVEAVSPDHCDADQGEMHADTADEAGEE
jgi:hypothetical protein